MKNILTVALISLFSAGAFAQECSLDLGRTASNTRYVTNDNGTITDQLTGLTWMRCQLGKTWDKSSLSCTGDGETFLWQSALTMVESINDANGNHQLHQFGGVDQWRMPNIKELISLKEVACHSPALSAKAFGDTFNFETGDLEAYVWSSTSAGNGQSVMTFDSINGEVYQYNAAQYKFSVLLVAE
ncbi:MULTISPECIES: DUF1566 domain-containing protein [Vibrio]|jgi:hypothetical protein|uniref:Lcl C-terminal domain-containing protein n=1 Tax=Vibrio TaxID=662 RepID=UPI000C81C95A|nr:MULTISPECIES: DUF1566 domain-containing protein [Vibrio]MBO7911117.1 DUF1566 domain-containing protein [Vibrio sp. G41H]MCF7489952.1 DUF1566 domain-containing protein [Vibrio sp. G-C-1]MDH5896411.1 DUF1566 domain-containing protein [Vibrio splendidus]MDH5902402.1 DUF1566 domain-containing protein [Vibrio splendidus]PMG19730.1 HutR like protein [Vibrio splendidus]